MRPARILALHLLIPLAVLLAGAGCAGDPRARQLRGAHTIEMTMELLIAYECPPLELAYDAALAASPATARLDAGVMVLEYPIGRGGSARALADTFGRALTEELARAGLALDQTVLLQLRPADCWPAPLRIEGRWRAPGSGEPLMTPIALLPTGVRFSEALGPATLPAQTVFSLTRELVRHALIMRERATVLEDDRALFFSKRRYATRWFLEGMATQIAARVSVRCGLVPPYSELAAAAALDAIGPPILDWDRFQDVGGRSTTYYLAAWGLVARLIDRLGEEGFRDFMAALMDYPSVTGVELDAAIEVAGGRRLAQYFLPIPPRAESEIP